MQSAARQPAAGEIALAAILLIGAGLLMQSLANLQRVRLGFDPRHLMTFQLAPPVPQYPLADKGPQLYRRLIENLQLTARRDQRRGFQRDSLWRRKLRPASHDHDRSVVLPPGTAVPIDWRSVSNGYFDTMRIPMLRGRTFTDGTSRRRNW